MSVHAHTSIQAMTILPPRRWLLIVEILAVAIVSAAAALWGGFDPTSVGLCALAGVGAFALFNLLVFDALDRAAAKRRLAEILKTFSTGDREVLSRLIEQKLLDATGSQEQRSDVLTRLTAQLSASGRAGALAVEALLQRSRTGRRRYLDAAIRRADVSA